MMQMLEPLESRVMMSVTVTSARLTADENAITAARSAYLNVVATLGDTLVSESRVLETLLPAGKANLAVAKKALAAEAKVLAAVRQETAALANDSVSLSAKAVAAGNADIAKPGKSADSKLQKAALALLKKVNADQTKITNDKTLSALYVDFNTIILSNPSATSFAAQVTKIENAVSLNAVPNAANNLISLVSTLTNDLGVTHIP